MYQPFIKLLAGIIGGRLEAFMFLAWGAGLANTGVPFVFYLHDLGTDPRCFISWSDQVKMIFFLPQLFCATIGMFCGVVILCNLSTSALRCVKRIFFVIIKVISSFRDKYNLFN